MLLLGSSFFLLSFGWTVEHATIVVEAFSPVAMTTRQRGGTTTVLPKFGDDSNDNQNNRIIRSSTELKSVPTDHLLLDSASMMMMMTTTTTTTATGILDGVLLGGGTTTSSTYLVALEPTTLPFPAGLTDLVGSAGGDPMLVVGGAAVAVLGLGLSVLASSSSSMSSSNTTGRKADKVEEAEPEPEPIDVSIPYDAAVILAYTEWRNDDPDLNKSDMFAQFKQRYLEKTVAEVTLKEKTRRFDAFLASSSSSQ